MDKLIEKTHRGHLAFIHPLLLNDQNSEKFRHSRCQQGIDCKSQSLRHHLFYHSLESEHKINFDLLTDQEKKSFIAFHETTKQKAFNIAKNGFPYGDTTNTNRKNYLHLKQDIYLTRSCTQNILPTEAIICARLN